MIKKGRFWLVLILVLTAALRFWHLGSNPPALTWDEAAWGYNAYCLGNTARDEFGRLLPWDYLESFGDFKPPVYAYLAVLPVKIFGLNEFATRFPSALLGLLTVWLTYWLVRELFVQESKRELMALAAAFLLSISPWHIMLSRAAFEANVATFFLLAGVLCFFKAMRTQKWFLLFSAAAFALSLNTFNTARVVAPLLVLALGLGFRKELWRAKKWVVASVILAFLILLPAFSHLLSPEARLRFQEVNIFSDSGVVQIANQEIANDNGSWWSALLHNRRWGFAREFLRHYFDHFKPSFLFIRGDGNPKFSTQDVGELYLWELPFLVVGILLLLRKKPGFWWLVFYWLLVGIIPAATARETPHALRIETTLPTWQILTAFGLIGIWTWFSKLKLKKGFRSFVYFITFSLLLLNFIFFQHGYWRHYPTEFSGEWQYPYKPSIEYLKQVEGQYDHVWFTSNFGRPYIYFLFYLKQDPDNLWRKLKVSKDPYGFVQVDGFGKYHFFREPEKIFLEGRTMVFDLPRNIEEKIEPKNKFYLLNGAEALVAHDFTIKPEYLNQQNGAN